MTPGPTLQWEPVLRWARYSLRAIPRSLSGAVWMVAGPTLLPLQPSWYSGWIVPGPSLPLGIQCCVGFATASAESQDPFGSRLDIPWTHALHGVIGFPRRPPRQRCTRPPPPGSAEQGAGHSGQGRTQRCTRSQGGALRSNGGGQRCDRSSARRSGERGTPELRQSQRLRRSPVFRDHG